MNIDSICNIKILLYEMLAAGINKTIMAFYKSCSPLKIYFTITNSFNYSGEFKANGAAVFRTIINFFNLYKYELKVKLPNKIVNKIDP